MHSFIYCKIWKFYVTVEITLNVVVEHTIRVLVLIQQTLGVDIGEVFELDQCIMAPPGK